MQEGKGEALYEIGVKDNGEAHGISQHEMIKTLKVLFKMAKALDAKLTILSIKKGNYGEIARLMVRPKVVEEVKSDIKIILLGDNTAGKATLLGVMVSGEEDNGRGLARQRAFKHSHQLADGDVCTIHHEVLGFNSGGQITNVEDTKTCSLEEIYKNSYKVLTFIDVDDTPEHTKEYLQTKVSQTLNYVMLCVVAEKVSETFKSYFRLAISLNVPIIVVISKCDQVDEDGINNTIQDIEELSNEVYICDA